MNSPQLLVPRSPGGISAANALALQIPVDDDVALGCECADPALQIERWAQEQLFLRTSS